MLAQELFDLSGQTAFVTGASSGLGWQFAKTLAVNGAEVWIAARSVDKLADLKLEIEADGGVAHILEMDVSDKLSVTTAFEALNSANAKPNILVNNAGIARDVPFLEQSDEDWAGIQATNVEGVRQVSIQAARLMIDNNLPGQIINIASILGMGVAKGVSAYAVAKAAVVQLTKAMALELAVHDINVNAIAPGYIRTNINARFFDSGKGDRIIASIPQKRIGQTSDLDGLLLLLASRKASGYMTGSIVTADGGHILPI